MKKNQVVSICILVVVMVAICADVCSAGHGCPNSRECANYCRKNIKPATGPYAGKRPCSGTCHFLIRCTCIYCP
ncbi:unnamed protein product [Allacma fusca]|uniref:Uncharacterized protein n=1 Tax=Allacma fusca TaxID=39272 RepID=A0A8J2JTS1_9HEXA|nr:unnamed protein product [Allacma fusca]